jgi:hypothetical protein
MRGGAFERFVGIDWSGAKKEYQRGIQIAEFCRGDARPQLVSPPSGVVWSRRNVLKFITAPTERRTLVGIDFAFSIPWDEGSVPRGIANLSKVDDLWKFVDDFCGDEDFFYAGPMWRSADSPLRPYVLCPGHKGCRFSSDRLRVADLAIKPRPETIYKIVGAKTVGAGSFAGMRILHALRQLDDKRIAIWPFDQSELAKIVVAEIYPSSFYAMAKQRRPNPKKDGMKKVEQVIDAVLEHFRIPAKCDVRGLSGDQLDALISAAGLACVSEDSSAMSIPEAFQRSAFREGWILGASFGERL